MKFVRPKARPVRVRAKAGYDHRWWGEGPAPGSEARASYWGRTRRPLPCLAFVIPLLIVYEAGVVALAGSGGVVPRAGADAWLRQALGALGLTDRWLLPLALVLALLGWQAADRRDWRFSPATLLGMALESLVLALALIGLGRLVDLGFVQLERRHALIGGSGPVRLAAGAEGPLATALGFLGAGLYEEALFRLALIPALFGLLRVLQAPKLLAGTLAVTASALLFSLAHHAGSPGEAFTWFAFIFRWTAGVYFAWVFVARGFGVAVGTHTAYDLLVGWLGWHW